MKVLQVGSSSIHFTNYLNSQKDYFDETFVISEDKIEGFSNLESKTLEFRTLNPLKLMKAIKELKNTIQQWKPDLIHLHQINRLAFFVARAGSKLKIPIVATAWGSDVLLMPKKNPLFLYLVKKTILRSKVVTADSEEMIRAMQVISPKSKFVHVQYGIEPIESGVKEKVIYSNRLHKPLYRIIAIINYFSEFSKSNEGWKLAIGATGSETPVLVSLVKELHLERNVIFLGWLDTESNNSWYSKSTIYISIPESDGTAVSLLEAMSAGCIPVVSDLEVSREWIEDGKNGVIEKKDKNPLIEAMEINLQLATDINERLIEERATRNASQIIFQKIYSDVV